MPVEQYQDTKFGSFPSDWDIVRLDTISDAIDPQPDHRTPPKVPNGLPYVGVNNFLPDGSIDVISCRKVSPKVLNKQRESFLIEEGDILFGKIGTIGLARFLPTNGVDYALSANVVLIKPKTIPYFVLTWLESGFVMRQIYRQLHTTSQPAFGIQRIRALQIVLPPLDEQCRIAEILGTWDEAITLIVRLIAAKQRRKKGLMQQLLTGKCRFGEFKGEWREVLLSDVVSDLKSGLSRKLLAYDIGLPMLRSNNITEQGVSFTDIKYWYKDDPQGAKTENYFLEEGDILVNFINSTSQIGKCALYENELRRDVIYTTNLMRLRTNEHLRPEYFLFLSQMGEYDRYIHAITKPAVNQASFTTKDFLKFKFLLPRIEEQRRIAAVLTACDEEIELLGQKLSALKRQKKGLMQQLLTGKVRVKV